MATNQHKKRASSIELNAYIATCYFLTGYFCSLLAVPPGFVTAVWIPAGIALGATLVYGPRILPAIFLGAFAINAYSQVPINVSLFTGMGAVLQAYIIAHAIIHWAKIDLAEYQIKHILLFALLAGPLGCLINTSFSSLALILSHTTPVNHILPIWITWWIGDSIGALTITPMFLILFANPRKIWKPRIVPILLPLSVCFLIAILLASLVRIFAEDHQRWEAYFVLMSGQLFCILMNIILSIIYGQRSLIEREVGFKTSALQQAMLDLEKMAHFDSLTDIPNRRSFLKHLSATIARSSRNETLMATCLIDLDNFKQINDALGHPHGDELLKTIPKIFYPMLRENDYFARLGGDEFGLILEDIQSASDVTTIIERLVNKLSQPLNIFNSEINTSFSVGIALYPSAGTTAEELIKNADIAMYRAKRSGKDTYQFFNEEINRQIKRLQTINSHMKNALNNNEFYLHYEPQFDTITQNFIGAEALLRWNSPALGEVSPSEFIQIAEDNNQIREIGEWALRRACQDFKEMISTLRRPITLSINISSKQLEDDNFLVLIPQLSEEFNLINNPLQLEITESSLLKNPDHTIQILHKLQPFGVRFALDDFGTSYFSMLHLKSMPISAIKIGPHLIQNILNNKNDFEIVNATIGLSKALGYSSIAEGIETEELYNCLRQAGCDFIQGHYLARTGDSQELMEAHDQFKKEEKCKTILPQS